MRTTLYFEPVGDTVVGYVLPNGEKVWSNIVPEPQRKWCIEAKYDLPRGYNPMGKTLEEIENARRGGWPGRTVGNFCHGQEANRYQKIFGGLIGMGANLF